LTLIYAAYVIGNLLALFFFGRLSDQIGRKNTTWPALAVATPSALTFVLAPGTLWLYVGRILSGFATGLTSGAATAWITELHPRKDKQEGALIAVGGNLLGLAVGPLMGGLLARADLSKHHIRDLIFLQPPYAEAVPKFPRRAARDSRWA
jgi:MFS family permease